MAKNICIVALAMMLLSCATTQKVLDSSLMSGNQNPIIGTAGAVSIAIITDIILLGIEHGDTFFGNGELEDMEQEIECECDPEITLLTDACITFCTGDIDPANPVEDFP